jgi:hypothetical protein
LAKPLLFRDRAEWQFSTKALRRTFYDELHFLAIFLAVELIGKRPPADPPHPLLICLIRAAHQALCTRMARQPVSGSRTPNSGGSARNFTQ